MIFFFFNNQWRRFVECDVWSKNNDWTISTECHTWLFYSTKCRTRRNVASAKSCMRPIVVSAKWFSTNCRAPCHLLLTLSDLNPKCSTLRWCSVCLKNIFETAASLPDRQNKIVNTPHIWDNISCYRFCRPDYLPWILTTLATYLLKSVASITQKSIQTFK